ncbi:penicillin-binding protein [Brevibacillus brevis]|uniref:Penicillin-binding protein n=1 Tax=Brevibacillus brevis TaxID=1393 RepID=A0A2Z4MEZ3_BREBE|nr:serine hydrolase [Brevibacillus brevis]AWX54931.1 penicillin-binding protein [Brevibacillus brevis]
MKMFSKLQTVMATVLVFTMSVSLVSGVVSPTKVFAASVSGPDDPREVEQFADEFFNRSEIKNNMAGATFVVVKGDKVLFKKGYGYADVEKKIPVDPDRTVFRVASVSKVITATAVMQLAEQGKIDLNKDVSAYMGDARIPNNTGTPLTMKHLLTNATGFDYGDTSDSSTTDLKREVSLKKFVMDNLPNVIRKPGEFYRYDNLGFTIQGYVVEQVAGKPFGEYVQEGIFKPLGMENSDFRLTPSIVKKLAVPYNLIGQPIPTYATVPTELPDGGMLSTGSDMAKFMIAHLNKGKLGNATIMEEETAAEMQRPHLSVHPKLNNMALGFEYANQQNYNGQYVIEKAGDLQGYHTGMWLIPEEKVGVFVTVNKDFEIRTPLIEAFMDHYYPKNEQKRGAFALAKQELTKFEGTYSDLRNRMWTTRIRAEGGKLIVKDPLGEHVLYEVEPLLFQDEQGIKAAFKLNDHGDVQAFYYDLKSDSWAEKLPEPQRYQDVENDHPYASYIYHLRQIGVFADMEGDNRFSPEQQITKGEFVGWFIKWSGIAPSKHKPIYTDLSGNKYAREIQAAYELGLLKASADGKFYPNEPLTRQEAATIVWRMAFGYLHAEPKKAKLSGRTDAWALEGVHFVVAKGLYGPEVVKGRDGSLDYKSEQLMVRKEAAALLSRFADQLF